MKKSQSSIFYILGIILVILSVFMFNQYYDSKKTVVITDSQTIISGLSQEQVFVKDYIETCLEKTSEDGFDFLLIQNGDYERGQYLEGAKFKYIIFINYSSETYKFKYPFSKKNFLENLSVYIEDSINDCLGSLDFNKTQFKIVSYSEPKVETRLLQNNIYVELDEDITLSYNNKTINVNKFNYEIENTPLNQIDEDLKFYWDNYYNYIFYDIYRDYRIQAIESYQNSVKYLRTSGTKVTFYEEPGLNGLMSYRIHFDYDGKYRESTYVFGIYFESYYFQ